MLSTLTPWQLRVALNRAQHMGHADTAAEITALLAANEAIDGRGRREACVAEILAAYGRRNA